MITDGNISKRDNQCKIALQKSDSEVLKKLSNIILGTNQIKEYNAKGAKEKSVVFSIHNKKFKEQLFNYGIMPAKTFLTRYPTYIPTNMHRHILRGLLDGDGHIGINNNKPRIEFIGTKELINDIEDIVNNILKLNIFFCIKKDSNKHRNNIMSFSINRKIDQLKFLKLLYSDCYFYIDRKYEKAHEAIVILEKAPIVKDFIESIKFTKNMTIDEYIFSL